ncbi:MAG TPA: phospholipid carrier-dependent glycosyltransferase [Candidatus Acidoferrum sp.]|jgi:dolichyl-phosphate-mannose--protein O-mannosyl transferase|nr:phospholipid carrier-dependent glycosyltransferase [Candidatus Acidoferrum sp.]
MKSGSPSRSPTKSLVPSRIIDHPGLVAMILGVVSLLLILAGIGRPAAMYFDEGLFVREARIFLTETPDYPSPLIRELIREHSLAKPPLGKLIMAMGMRVAGDTPFGWRVAAGLCGSLTLVAVYLWALLLLRDSRIALLAGGLTLFDNYLFVMSRVGTMDAFFVVFLLWSVLAYTAAIELELRAGRRKILLICSGLLMGLAGACKWNAIDSLAVLFLVSVALLWMAHRQPPNSNPAVGRHARNIRQIGPLALFLGLVVAPFTSYILTYWPQCRVLKQPFSVHELIALHRTAWDICTTWVTNPAVALAWYKWPLNTTPQRGLSYLLGNPVVAWGGLVALIFCLWRFWKTVALPEGMVLLLFSANFFQWAVTPEKGLMYYYYYPAMLMLGVAIAIALRSLPQSIFGVRVSLVVFLAAAIVFLWCYPRMAHLDSPWDCALGCWT